MTRRPPKNDHTNKNPSAKNAYRGFINAHGKSNFEGGTSLGQEGLVVPTDDTAHGIEKDNNDTTSTNKILPKNKRPYQSKRNWIEKNFKKFVFWLAGILVVASVSFFIETIWSMNRELGVLTTRLSDTKEDLNAKLTDMKNKYDGIFATSDNNKINIITVSSEIRGDIKNLQDRVNKIENKAAR
jgi:hypothetical protein